MTKAFNYGVAMSVER